MADNLIVINKARKEVVATHRIEQNITLEEHYPPDKYGDCEIIILPKGKKVDLGTRNDPRDAMTKAEKEEVLILTKERELKQVAEPDYRQAAIDDLKATGILKG